MKISEIPFEKEKVSCHELKVGELHDGTVLSVPVAVINGSEQGKTLLVSSGVNGNIYNGIEAARRLLVELEPAKIKGRLVVMPVINRGAFLTRSRANELENFPGPTMMVGAFPGDPEGILTSRTAHVVSKEVLLDVDYIVELGTAALTGSFAPYVIMYPMPAELIEKVRGIAKAFGAKFILDYSQGAPPTVKGRAAMTALSHMIPAILIEGGEASRIQEPYVKVHITGVKNVMKYLGMLEGKPESPTEQVTLTKTLTTRANRGGFLKLKVKLGDRVSKGQILAEITDIFYKVLERITSPADGYVLRAATTATVNCGDSVISVGQTSD